MVVVTRFKTGRGPPCTSHYCRCYRHPAVNFPTGGQGESPTKFSIYLRLFGGWKNVQTYSPNGGNLMVVYHGSIRQKFEKTKSVKNAVIPQKSFKKFCEKLEKKLVPGTPPV